MCSIWREDRRRWEALCGCLPLVAQPYPSQSSVGGPWVAPLAWRCSPLPPRPLRALLLWPVAAQLRSVQPMPLGPFLWFWALPPYMPLHVPLVPLVNSPLPGWTGTQTERSTHPRLSRRAALSSPWVPPTEGTPIFSAVCLETWQQPQSSREMGAGRLWTGSRSLALGCESQRWESLFLWKVARFHHGGLDGKGWNSGSPGA